MVYGLENHEHVNGKSFPSSFCFPASSCYSSSSSCYHSSSSCYPSYPFCFPSSSLTRSCSSCASRRSRNSCKPGYSYCNPYFQAPVAPLNPVTQCDPLYDPSEDKYPGSFSGPFGLNLPDTFGPRSRSPCVSSRCSAAKFHAEPWHFYLTATYTSIYSLTTSILTSAEVNSNTVSYTIFTIAATDVPNAYFSAQNLVFQQQSAQASPPLASPPASPPVVLQLPLTFEFFPSDVYNFVDVNGAVSSIIDNPNITISNPTNKVALYADSVGYGGALLKLSNPIDFSIKTAIKMLVLSPNIGTPVYLGFQKDCVPDFATDTGVVVTTSIANAWEELVFNFTGIIHSNNYTVIVFSASSASTYYFDNVRQV